MPLDPRITFSRAGIGTYYRSDGFLVAADHNYVTQSEDFSSASWTKNDGATVTANSVAAPDGNLTADRLNHATAGTVSGGSVSQFVGAPPYRAALSVYAKAGSKTFLLLGVDGPFLSNYAFFNLSAGTVGTTGSSWLSSGIESVGGGWYRCYAVTGSGSTVFIRVGEADNVLTCTSPGNLYIWGAQFEWVVGFGAPPYFATTTGPGGAPRFEYHPVTHAPLGLLIEEARTNLATDSQDFTTLSWTRTGATIEPDYDQRTTADLLVASGSPCTVSSTTAVGAPYVASIFAKKETTHWIYLVGQAADSPRAWFDIDAGTVGTVQSGLTGAGIQDTGDGWYRCWIADTPGSGAEPVMVGLANADNSTTVVLGSSAYIWGAQCEAGTFMTSYIATGGTAVTRAADTAIMTGTNFSSWYTQPGGTFIIDFDTLAPATTQAGILSADANTAVQQIMFSRPATGLANVAVNNSGVMFSANAGALAGGLNRLGLSFEANDFAACLNGGTVALDTTGTLPIPTQLRIGIDNVADGVPLNGHIRRIRFYNEAKSDVNLQIVTSLTEAPALALEWTTDETELDPSFTVTFSNTAVGDVLTLEVSAEDYSFASLHGSESNTLDAAEVAAGSVTMGASIPTLTLVEFMTYYARVKLTRGTTALYSKWVQKDMRAASDPSRPSVKLLFGFDGGVSDEAGGKAVFSFGSASTDAVIRKFGSGSLLLGGAGDYLTLNDHVDWTIGGNQFTIEAWIRFAAVTDGCILAQSGTSEVNFQFYQAGTTTLRLAMGTAAGASGGLITGFWAPVANAWYHVAVDRDASGKVRIYANGAMIGSGTNATVLFNSTKAMHIGRLEFNTGFDFQGRIDELRFTNGVARYASDFGYVLPTAAFPRS